MTAVGRSLLLEAEFGPLEADVEWSPESESEKGWDLGDTQEVRDLQAELSEGGVVQLESLLPLKRHNGQRKWISCCPVLMD